MHNAWPAFIILHLGDPHLLEGGQRRQDGAADPHRVLPLRGSDDLDLDGGGGKAGDLPGHSVGDSREHGGASGQHDVVVKVLADVHVALEDGVVGGLVHARHLHAHE